MKSVCCFVLGIFSLWLFNFSQFHCVWVCFTALCLELLLVSFLEYIQDVSCNSIGFCFVFFGIGFNLFIVWLLLFLCKPILPVFFPKQVKTNAINLTQVQGNVLSYQYMNSIYTCMQLGTLFNYVQLGGKNQSWWKIDLETRLSTPWNCIYIMPANAHDHSTATNA